MLIDTTLYRCFDVRRILKRPAHSGGASAVEDPGHFEDRKSGSPARSSGYALFSSKKVDDLFLVVALKTQAANSV